MYFYDKNYVFYVSMCLKKIMLLFMCCNLHFYSKIAETSNLNPSKTTEATSPDSSADDTN